MALKKCYPTFSVGNVNTRWRSAVQQQEYNSAMRKNFVSLNIVH